MGLKNWFRAYWNPTRSATTPPVWQCPVCRSDRDALTIPASPEFETHVCLTCSYEWSIPSGVFSRGLPLWGESNG
jgi:hypothetical protein